MATATLDHLREKILQNNTVDQNLYQQYDVKRGLRNKDGSGVLAGLTQISSVVGAKIIDGDSIPVEGTLKMRGIDLMDLMTKFPTGSRYCFETTCFLLLVGSLPTEVELKAFNELLDAERDIPQEILDQCIKGIPSKNVMNKLMTAVTALYAYDDDADSIDAYENFLKSIKLIAKIPTIIAYSYLAAFKSDATFVQPPKGVSIAESFLTLLHEGKTPSELEGYILDLCLVLHAEHGGGNNSTFTTYVVTSSNSDIYSTTAASIASLKGPLHGAANSKVREMMEDIKSNLKSLTDKDELAAYIGKILRQEAHDGTGKIYGLGHAVYTKSDPRAVVLKGHAKDLAQSKGRSDELQLYFNMEELGPKLFNEFKGIDKTISPNVDFFSGFVYDCLGIPQPIYTPLFAMARVSGWCSHRIEELNSGKRIIRPGYKYVGS